jgi:Leucine-rich repeat (LRR) protein
MPTSIKTLIINENILTSVPTVLHNLTTLKCGCNKLTELPLLPNSISYLTCERNLLNKIHNFPLKLKVLNCSCNNLKELPPFPDSLTYLNCSFNQLITIPDLPPNIKSINIYGNPHVYKYETAAMINRTNDFIRKCKNIIFNNKFKKPFIAWMWRARERIAMRVMHPSNIEKLLNTDRHIADIDDIDLLLV